MNQTSLNKLKTKILKVYSILDNLIVKSFSKKEEIDINILKSLKEKKGEFEMLETLGDESNVMGILVCFKFFKSISKFLI